MAASRFYEQCPILSGEDDTKIRRLALTKQTGAVGQRVASAGIGVAERM